MKMIKGTIKKNIIAGLLVTVPVLLTYIVLKFVITRIDALVVPVVSKIIGEKAMENFNGYFVRSYIKVRSKVCMDWHR